MLGPMPGKTERMSVKTIVGRPHEMDEAHGAADAHRASTVDRASQC